MQGYPVTRTVSCQAEQEVVGIGGLKDRGPQGGAVLPLRPGIPTPFGVLLSDHTVLCAGLQTLMGGEIEAHTTSDGLPGACVGGKTASVFSRMVL